LTSDSGSKYTVDLSASPDKIVSDGQQESTVRCMFVPSGGAGAKSKRKIKEEIPVTFRCKKLKLEEKVQAKNGIAIIKIKPARPVGKAPVTVETPFGNASTVISVAPTPKQWARDMIQSLVIAFVVAMFIVRPLFLQSFYIPSGSMIPTFYENDRLMGSMLKYRLGDPQRGDIVIFKSTREADRKTYNLGVYKHVSITNYIKRLIAVGGDTVEVRRGVTFVNGKALDEPYLNQEHGAPYQPDFPRVKVPKDSLFFMGDNRWNSSDSRFCPDAEWPYKKQDGLCFVPRKNVVAKAWVQFWPLDRVRAMKHARY
jgi:signal peptidase I